MSGLWNYLAVRSHEESAGLATVVEPGARSSGHSLADGSGDGDPPALTTFDVLLYWITILWALGFVEFNTQLLLGPSSRTFGFSLYLSFGLALIAGLVERRRLTALALSLWSEVRSAPILFKMLLLVCLVMFALAAYESRLPPRHPQEFDAINYHMALPRQHMLAGSLSHIPWSSADLWPLPVQYGLAPFWFMGPTLHKVPQFLAAAWAFLMLLSLGRRLAPGEYRGWVPALAVFTTHGVMIQLGTAMLDLANLYFLLASLHSIQRRKPVLMGVNLAVYASAKAFHPAQVAVGLLALGAIALVARRNVVARVRRLAPALALAFVVILLLLGRSSVVGLDRAGTPLFPFGACMVASARGCQGEPGIEIRASAAAQVQTADAYGVGRGPLAFAQHLWLVSVPTSWVNNQYDYPLGLAWLFLVVMLAFAGYQWLATRRLPPFAALTLIAWGLFWVGSHQSRWLYPALAFGWLATMAVQRRASANLLLGLLLMSAALSLLSQWFAFRGTLFEAPAAIQAERTAQVRVDPSTGLVASQETLYVDRYISRHAPGDPYWILNR